MEKAYWLAWSEVSGIGVVTIKRIWQTFGSLETAWSASLSELAKVHGIGSQTLEVIKTSRAQINPSQLYKEHSQKNPNFWTLADPAYPHILAEIPDPPPILYWQGNMTAWNANQTVAIVGTRHPSKYGKVWAYKIAKSLAEAGFVIVSGMAEGIDAEAHRGCLDANGKTIAVVGTSLDKVYPPQHRQLFQEIFAQGLVLSEYSHGTITDKSSFPRRNRIIAGLCRATLVIEAPDKSGALITAHQANDYGREVYALPNGLEIKEARGCLELIAKGASVILGVDELLTALGSLPRLDREQPPLKPVAPPITNSQHQQIYNLFPPEGILNLDAIAEIVQIPTGELSAMLLEMELSGLIKNCGGMHYQIRT